MTGDPSEAEGRPRQVAIVGGGPAGLMAAEALSPSGLGVTVYDAMPTLGRKLLMAGKSGLNLTHAEDGSRFVGRFGAASGRLRPALEAFGPAQVRDWAAGLGSETFVGSSGRVFPTAMKASPLLRAWRRRLEERGVRILTRYRWLGFAGEDLRFATPEGERRVRCDGALLALGGASWPRLGSDGAWLPWLAERGVAIQAFRPANCGFEVAWTEGFRERFAGAPIKAVTAASGAGSLAGELVVTRTGIEGSLVYAHATALRDALAEDGRAVLLLDLAPGRSREQLAQALARQPAKASFSNRLRKAAGITGVKAGLVRELVGPEERADPARLAERIKALPLPLLRPRPLAEAISSAGGVSWDAVDARWMLTALPGVFVAGEMLDWEAPTGGYLLTACLATGRAAAEGLRDWLGEQRL